MTEARLKNGSEITVDNMITEMIIEKEGGYKFVNDPNDPGGMTYAGITYNVFKKHVDVVKLPHRIADMYNQYGQFMPIVFRTWATSSDEHERFMLNRQVHDIYKEWYYTKIDLHKWPKDIAYVFFCMAVNMGTDQPTRFIQRTVGAKVDGIYGPKTRAAVENWLDNYNLHNTKPFIRKIVDYWIKEYCDLVQGNCEAWENYYTKNGPKPSSRRWRYLEGWVFRALSYYPK